MVLRGEEVIIPHGDFVVEENDNLHIIASETEITAFCKKLKIFKPRAKNVFVIGGGKIAYYLAQTLIANGVNGNSTCKIFKINSVNIKNMLLIPCR